MPRRRVIAKREILPDPKHHSQLLAKFINVLMVDGKKSIAETITYGALEIMQLQLKKSKKVKDEEEGGESGKGGKTGHGGASLPILQCFEQALDNVGPNVEVRSRRVGGATYQIPIEVRHDRKVALAIRWVIAAARSRSESGMKKKLAEELIAAFNNTGSAVKKRDDTHRMAKANQAFAHFR